jgi:hypothetical protein
MVAPVVWSLEVDDASGVYYFVKNALDGTLLEYYAVDDVETDERLHTLACINSVVVAGGRRSFFTLKQDRSQSKYKFDVVTTGGVHQYNFVARAGSKFGSVCWASIPPAHESVARCYFDSPDGLIWTPRYVFTEELLTELGINNSPDYFGYDETNDRIYFSGFYNPI